MTEKEAIEGFMIDNALLGENESGTVERNNIAIKCIEELQEYRSICDSPEKLKLIDALYLERCEEINRLKAELAEYKKLEEEGLLLRLPCKVGDTVYYVDDIRKFVDECSVTKVDCRTMNRYHMGISIEMQGKLWHCIGAELIGEVAFHTQEEAEQALAELYKPEETQGKNKQTSMQKGLIG